MRLRGGLIILWVGNNMSQQFIYQSGVTLNGDKVVAGLWKFRETVGLPLSSIFDLCQKHKLIPDFPQLYKDMLGSGIKRDRVLCKIQEELVDSYDKEFVTIVMDRLKELA